MHSELLSIYTGRDLCVKMGTFWDLSHFLSLVLPYDAGDLANMLENYYEGPGVRIECTQLISKVKLGLKEIEGPVYQN